MSKLDVKRLQEESKQKRTIRNKDFGNFIKSLRKQKFYISEDDGYSYPWDQEKLTKESGLTLHQIQKIEQGKVIDLFPHLDILAATFELDEIGVRSLYKKAGYIHDARYSFDYDRSSIESLLHKIRYPCSARTPVWDFIGFNEYHRRIWGYKNHHLDKLNDGSKLGANLLRCVFDPALQRKTQKRDHELIVWAFRSSSSDYLDSKRFRTIKSEASNYKEFQRAWARSEHIIESEQIEKKQRVITRIYSFNDLTLEFLPLRIPKRYVGDATVSIYIPTDKSQEKYAQLVENITNNRVHMFGDK